MTGNKLLKLLFKNGWVHVKTEGSHYHLVKEGEKIILPYHGNKDVSKGTEHSILKIAKLK